MDRFVPRSAAGISADYAAWVRAHDTLDDAARAAIADDVARLPYRPLISLLLPLDAGIAAGWRRRSRRCAGNSIPTGRCAPPAAATRPACSPPRPRATRACAWSIRRRSPTRPRPPTRRWARPRGCSSRCSRPATSLPTQALYEVAVALAGAPETELLYTDEDRIDTVGERAAPRFKTGWDPDLLLAHDYIGSLAVWRRATIVGRRRAAPRVRRRRRV